ncbi:MAG: tetratricopeptide repeat protein [Treponema sp.]|uniref:tetratricopeptide repeat protein n=1 Tax=Treponema sp. TaxID=166 RepID=UPI001B15EF55|nr:tetratricopeptide repeat protein [Treponema sp.]MBO6218858.1 tetratricopeptide repeat protein [Treponema sp.]MBQ8680619.1 tetratricopeptide repeat protein [Treponema sp.]
MKLKALQTREIVKRKSQFLKKLAIFACLAALVSAGIFFAWRLIDSKINNGNSFINLKSKWKVYDYQGVYDISSAILYKSPFNTKARTYNGYASFFLAVSQSDVVQSLSYIDESINSLRIALQGARFGAVAQIEYMLGKAYFYKDLHSSYYYYADLAIDYLLKAKKHGYKADDIPELLGLSYASLGMTMESISAFTEALLVRESDILLLSIAEQYHNVGQDNAAEQYLFRISQECKDEQIILKSHLLMGNMYLEREQFDDAEKEFNFILEKNENSADAYYGLGVIYESRGEAAKARAEWRKALRIQNNHPLALKKMSEYK